MRSRPRESINDDKDLDLDLYSNTDDNIIRGVYIIYCALSLFKHIDHFITRSGCHFFAHSGAYFFCCLLSNIINIFTSHIYFLKTHKHLTRPISMSNKQRD